MTKMKDMRIGKRLIVSFIIVLVITTLGSLTGAGLIWYSDSKYSSALELYGFSQGDLGILLQSITESKSLTQNFLNAADSAAMQEAQKAFDEEMQNISSYMDIVEDTLSAPEEYTLFEDIKKNVSEYQKVSSEVMQLVNSNRHDDALQVYRTTGEPLLESCISNVSELLASYKATGDRLSTNLSNQSVLMMILMIIIIAASIIVSMTLAKKAAKGISTPIESMLVVAKEIAKGNLSVDVDIESKDEIGELGQAFKETVHNLNLYVGDISKILEEIGKGNLTVDSSVEYQGAFQVIENSIETILKNLNSTLGDIENASNMVANGAGQIASAGQNLSEGAMEQAGAVEELNASINEVADQVNNNAQNAQDASSKAVHVAVEIDKSNKKMEEMIEAMNRISEASSMIKAIMGTIEDIATETNLLSLNAAIEAARAGEAGRGFAVVANEIGTLAQQSADAAKNTSELIETTVKAVNYGSKIVDETAEALKKVISGAEEVTTDISIINDASERQAVAISEIQSAVNQISGVVQNNSATAEESAASSEELSGQSQILNELIRKFEIKRN